MQIKETIRTFISYNFLHSDNGVELEDSQSFMESGIIDSTGVLELVSFLEETFNLNVNDDELLPDNFDSIQSLTHYIQKKLNNSSVHV